MAKYRRPAQNVAEEPTFFAKHYWHLAVEYVTKHQDEFLTGALVVAVLILGVTVWYKFSASKAAQAWASWGTAGSVAELEADVQKYGSTPAGPVLKLSLADQYYLAGQSDKAAAIYADVAASATGLLADRARFDLASALENTGKFSEAKDVLETLVKSGGFWGVKAGDRLKALPAAESSYRDYHALLDAAKADEAARLASSISAVVGSSETAVSTGSSAPAPERSASTESSTAPADAVK